MLICFNCRYFIIIRLFDIFISWRPIPTDFSMFLKQLYYYGKLSRNEMEFLYDTGLYEMLFFKIIITFLYFFIFLNNYNKK